jgi:hypothetical protein
MKRCVCLIDCFEPHEQFFSYWRLSPLPLKGLQIQTCSFTCHTYCDAGPLILRSYLTDPLISLLNAVLLTKELSLPILNVLSLTRPAREGLEITTSRMLSESTTTTLPQPVNEKAVLYQTCKFHDPEGRAKLGTYLGVYSDCSGL